MNPRITTAVGALFVLACAASSWAGLAPDVYRSTDLGGSVLQGRMSLSEVEGPVTKPGMGDVFSAASWDGKWLGTQWMFSCGAQDQPTAIKRDMDREGSGTVWTESHFAGGRFSLAPDGPWYEKRDEIGGKLYDTQLRITETYEWSKLTKVEMALEAWGMDQNDRRVVFEIARCLSWGDTELGRMPPTYPPLLDMACQPTRTEGYWYDVAEITIKLDRRSSMTTLGSGSEDRTMSDVPAAARPSSWGAIKAIYR